MSPTETQTEQQVGQLTTEQVVELTRKHNDSTWRFQKGWNPMRIVDADGCRGRHRASLGVSLRHCAAVDRDQDEIDRGIASLDKYLGLADNLVTADGSAPDTVGVTSDS